MKKKDGKFFLLKIKKIQNGPSQSGRVIKSCTPQAMTILARFLELWINPVSNFKNVCINDLVLSKKKWIRTLF